LVLFVGSFKLLADFIWIAANAALDEVLPIKKPD